MRRARAAAQAGACARVQARDPPPRSLASWPSTPSAPSCPERLRAPHVLRHTFCTLLAEHDVAIDVIRDLAGHASIRTTQKYIHVTDQRRGRAIARLERRRHPLDQPLEHAA
jgi:integrase